MMSLTGVWADTLIRVAIGIAAGEISIRYGAWWWLLQRQKERFASAPMIFGTAIGYAFICAIEINWILIRSAPTNAGRPTMTEGHPFIILMRLGLLAAACFLTYPVSRISYGHSWVRALVEMLVRLFLIGVSFLAGIECATLYHCQVLGIC